MCEGTWDSSPPASQRSCTQSTERVRRWQEPPEESPAPTRSFEQCPLWGQAAQSCSHDTLHTHVWTEGGGKPTSSSVTSLASSRVQVPNAYAFLTGTMLVADSLEGVKSPCNGTLFPPHDKKAIITVRRERVKPQCKAPPRNRKHHVHSRRRKDHKNNTQLTNKTATQEMEVSSSTKATTKRRQMLSEKEGAKQFVNGSTGKERKRKGT